LLVGALGGMGGALGVAGASIGIVAPALLALAGAASFAIAVWLASRRIAQLVRVVESGAEFFKLGASAARKSHGRMATTTAQQSSSVVETTATVMELTAAAGSIAENAAAASQAAERTATTMEEMEATVVAIADRSQALGERSRAIDDVLGLINEIAEQTSLLALNAAIEAARAGEAGKGFAVVASEVRKLAGRAVGSVDSIRELVAAIQVETTATVLATEHGARQARTVLELMGETSSLLEHSLLATQQQQSAAEQVAAAMTQIQTGAEAIVAACAERADDASDFERLGNELRTALVASGGGRGAATARA
jgi:methyl-accepting chemotaxis protein